MKILNSLLISLSISAALISNESDSFKQKDYVQANNAHEKLNNKYKISGEQILKGANIAGAAMGLFALAQDYKSTTSSLFGFGVALNIASIVTPSPQESPKLNTAVGVSNALWGIGNFLMFASSIINVVDQGLTTQVVAWACYYGAKSGVNIANAAYRLWYAKKQQH